MDIREAFFRPVDRVFVQFSSLLGKDHTLHADPRYDRYYIATTRSGARLYVCSLEMSKEPIFVRARGISAVVRLVSRGKKRASPLKGMKIGKHHTLEYYDKISIDDSADGAGKLEANEFKLLEEGLEWMRERIDKGRHVLVHCNLGQTRSPSMVIAYLMKYETRAIGDPFSEHAGFPIFAEQIALIVASQIRRRGVEILKGHYQGDVAGTDSALFFWNMLRHYATYLNSKRGYTEETLMEHWQAIGKRHQDSLVLTHVDAEDETDEFLFV